MRIDDSRYGGVGAGSLGEQARLDSLAAAGDVSAEQCGLERVFRDAGPQRLANPRDRLLADGDGATHQCDFAVRLDQPSVLHQFEPVEDLVAASLHPDDALRRDPVDGDVTIAATLLAVRRVGPSFE